MRMREGSGGAMVDLGAAEDRRLRGMEVRLVIIMLLLGATGIVSVALSAFSA